MELRTAIFGKEVSKYRLKEDQYPIELRYSPEVRNNIDKLLNLKITYRDMAANGLIRQIPLYSLAHVTDTVTIGGIKRKNQKRMITLSSNVLSNFTPNEVVDKVKQEIKAFHTEDGYSINFTGESADQQETADFLGTAMLISIMLVFLILVLQFNSISKPVIILTEIFFSVIGVLLGFAIFRMDVSVAMTGIGIVALAGIVVKNGILLVEFSDVLKSQGMKTREAIVMAGKTRLKPVLLTASATMLGLVPLAIGFNINFATLFSHFEPHIFFGGDSVVFWKPLSWTIIFGLGFATFLTLLLVPAMYLIAFRLWMKWRRYWFKPNPDHGANFLTIDDENII